MRNLAISIVCFATVSFVAIAAPVRLTSAGIWTTAGDTVSEQKSCGVSADVGGGLFALFGRSDRPSTLRLALTKQSWNIPDITVPIALSFDGGVTFNFIGTGHQSEIHADIPDADVKALAHHFTILLRLTVFQRARNSTYRRWTMVRFCRLRRTNAPFLLGELDLE